MTPLEHMEGNTAILVQTTPIRIRRNHHIMNMNTQNNFVLTHFFKGRVSNHFFPRGHMRTWEWPLGRFSPHPAPRGQLDLKSDWVPILSGSRGKSFL